MVSSRRDEFATFATDTFALFGEVDALGKGNAIVCTGSILIDEMI